MTHPTGQQAPSTLPFLSDHAGHKRRAALLRTYLAHHGIKLGQGHALEAVAALHRQKNWRTLNSRPDAPRLPGEAAERALGRRLHELGHAPSDALAQGAAALLHNPAMLLFDFSTLRFFQVCDPADLEGRELVVQFSNTEAAQVPPDHRHLLSQAAVENARAVHYLGAPSLGLYVDGVPLAPPGAVRILPMRGETYRHPSGLFMLGRNTLSPWPLLPLPERVGGDVLERLQQGHSLIWESGATVQLDGEDLLNDLGEPVPEWVDTDGTQVALWHEQLERALPGTSHYVVSHTVPDGPGGLPRAVRVSVRRGLSEVPEVDPLRGSSLVLDAYDPAVQAVAVALARQEATEGGRVFLANHPALVGSAGPQLAAGATLAPGGGGALLTFAGKLRPGELLVLYLGDAASEQAALRAAGQGARVVVVTGGSAGVQEWTRRLEEARAQRVERVDPDGRLRRRVQETANAFHQAVTARPWRDPDEIHQADLAYQEAVRTLRLAPEPGMPEDQMQPFRQIMRQAVVQASRGEPSLLPEDLAREVQALARQGETTEAILVWVWNRWASLPSADDGDRAS
ncbi:hypothetical protein [Deinococcus petrolearius]|uniref:Uncharacterized protein n=1 Tax=Deinococcus petrolearius TaxID=1751295 RepID=A0ABW1DL65_9DEIO